MAGNDRQDRQGRINASSYSEDAEDGHANVFVRHGVTFKGTIIHHGTIRIDGTMEGEIQTEACLLVGEGAVLSAKVSALVVISKGTMTGDLVAKEKVQLLAPAVLTGSVTTPLLSMEEGVIFNGRMGMNPVDGSGQGHFPERGGVQRRPGTGLQAASPKSGVLPGREDGDQLVAGSDG